MEEYRRLCAVIRAPDCIEGYHRAFDALYGVRDSSHDETKDPIWVHVSSLGLAISGSSKGFYYSKKPRFEVVPSLDAVAFQGRSNTWLRHIEGAWYMYLDYED